MPAVDVTVTGRLRPSQQRRLGQLSDPAEGDLAEVQRVDIERLAPQLPGEVVPMYIDLIESDPAEPQPFPEPVIAPELGEGNHLSYAVQWFIFSARRRGRLGAGPPTVGRVTPGVGGVDGGRRRGARPPRAGAEPTRASAGTIGT